MAVVVLSACQGGKAPALGAVPENEEARAKYLLGYSTGTGMRQYQLKGEDLAWVTRGMQDSALGKPPVVAFQDFDAKMQELAKARSSEAAKAQEAASQAVLRAAASESFARSLPSGLVFHELRAGQGAAPREGDGVKLGYRGRLPSGVEFDSSSQHGAPANFIVGGSIIPCWSQSVQLMRVGGKAKVTCPPSLAYGNVGASPGIPPGSALVFELELLEVTPRTAPSAEQAPVKKRRTK